jgi:hypothetical protein
MMTLIGIDGFVSVERYRSAPPLVKPHAIP